MGICASSNLTKQGGRMMMMNYSPSTAKVIHLEGSRQEFRHPIKAGHVLSQNPGCFLCCSESMYVHSRAPHVSEEEELQLGQIYFLLPMSKFKVPLSLQDLCVLAIKATTGVPVSSDDGVIRNSKVGFCRDGLERVDFPAAHGDHREMNRVV